MNRGHVLVTGATGFIGRHLCPSLVQSGWKVRATWVHSSPDAGRFPDIEWRRVTPLGSDTNWAPLLEGITAVVHLAALAHRIAPGDQLPAAAYDEANHFGTARLAEAVAAAKEVGRLVFISSIGAVTSLADERIDENSPCLPDTPYGRSKLAAEHAVVRILKSSQTSWCILRPTLVYGPGNPGNMARLLRLLSLPFPLPLASIHNRRTFLYIDNLVAALQLALVHPASANRTFCLADAEELSTPELLQGLGRAAGRPVRLFPCPIPVLRGLGWVGSVIQRAIGRSVGIDLPTIEKLCGSLRVDSGCFRRECGWQTSRSLEEALRATIRGESA